MCMNFLLFFKCSVWKYYSQRDCTPLKLSPCYFKHFWKSTNITVQTQTLLVRGIHLWIPTLPPYFPNMISAPVAPPNHSGLLSAYQNICVLQLSHYQFAKAVPECFIFCHSVHYRGIVTGSICLWNWNCTWFGFWLHFLDSVATFTLIILIWKNFWYGWKIK